MRKLRCTAKINNRRKCGNKLIVHGFNKDKGELILFCSNCKIFYKYRIGYLEKINAKPLNEFFQVNDGLENAALNK